MINCLVKRLLAYGFERSETARFDIFPQRFSNEFQVFNVFHNRPNRSMMRDKFFQPLGGGVFRDAFPSFRRHRSARKVLLSLRCLISLLTRFSTAIPSRAEGRCRRGRWSVLHARSPPPRGCRKSPSLDEEGSAPPSHIPGGFPSRFFPTPVRSEPLNRRPHRMLRPIISIPQRIVESNVFGCIGNVVENFVFSQVGFHNVGILCIGWHI